MEHVKRMMWPAEAWVVQFHPAADEYRNLHQHVLHMWRPVRQVLPKPNPDWVAP